MAEVAAPVGRRERTRRRLLDAARELITEKGVAGLRIQEITEGAGVALGSFYNHFASKEELVEAVVGESLSALAETVSRPTGADQDPAELVSNAIRRFVARAYEDPDFARLVVHLEHADALFMSAVWPAAHAALEEGVAAGRLKPLQVDLAVTTILGGALSLMRAIVDGRIGPGAETAYAEMCLRALGLPARQAAAVANRPLPPLVDATG
ncbi:TetR/AcrR family transcriptional regulator [Conexibacter sp. SYSU D00693]|uniref:TetR/AcrR family transcriptional regulator n=1 Tax=Conexibacter sp. SYSU D00693 TaxID=2812560 RepID=UPI00196B56F3|nr:TetR/AcrR family transcriptional regulator [Conexibacter sp. SYSU D00693]